MATNKRPSTGSEGTSGAGTGERAPAEQRPGRGGTGKRSPAKPFDPATAPEGPSLAEEEQRQFHATHFTADPRGSAGSGAPPGMRSGSPRRKVRGGTPPKLADSPDRTTGPKRRGGANP